ncbi:MAG TPA: DUF3551 domain-containing protein [Xanthobacteraceae bacterium]|jgi:hypothetical protein|nr:DUF3551 domain-containing protein [Xanthobacteraceae bacterium]
MYRRLSDVLPVTRYAYCVLTFLGAAIALASPAAAQSYPWCSNFADGAGTNCGWSTLEQCMITVRGSGGYCSQNDDMKSDAAAPSPHHSSKRRAHKNS